MSEFIGYYGVGIEDDINKNSTLGHLYIFFRSWSWKSKIHEYVERNDNDNVIYIFTSDMIVDLPIKGIFTEICARPVDLYMTLK